MIMDTSKITRLEIINQEGRQYVNHSVEAVELSFQDNNRTLKIFINEPYEKHTQEN